MSDDLVAHLEGMDWDDIRDRPSVAGVLMEDAAAEIARLRAALTNARREGMEEAARISLAMSISSPSVIAAAIRAAAQEVKP